MKLQTLKSRVQMLQAPAKVAVEVNPSSWRTSDQTAAQRGYGHAWRKAREGYLKKHPFCVMCLATAGIEAQTLEDVIIACTAKRIDTPWANTVDHKIAHRGDMTIFWDKTQWQSLCSTCHNSHAQRRDKALL